jgi:hypothetical protein
MKAPANQGEETDPDRESDDHLGGRTFLGRRNKQARNCGDTHHAGGEAEQRRRQRCGTAPKQKDGNSAEDGR